ncbi:bacterial regulatory s, tetR family protein [Mycobacterium xenopi 4042]|uniref:Bacterial regulatory s, tetR family protein n=1 Tax=Mycobacterium xenopi 4042 TaxID=1299334 RepID=X7ZWL8_MYCXE|nr:bacterial regulatory s, tetR family protein [Mycobacterium xenopi 4042]
MAKQAVAEKRQRRERGSISVDEILNGAFEVAEQVSIDNLSMPLLAKHLDVGVTSIYWYFRKKEDLLDAMTDRALGQYDFATPFVEGRNWRESLHDHAHKMRQTFRANPVLCDLILIRARSAKKPPRRPSRSWRKPSLPWSRPGCHRRTRSTPMHRSRCTPAARSSSSACKPNPAAPDRTPIVRCASSTRPRCR